MRLGYACINLSLSGTFRTCMLKSVKEFGVPFVREIAKANFNRVLRILEWNRDRKMYLYRLSSDLIPFGSHPILSSWDWWNDPDLIEISSRCKELSDKEDMRITIHPGQYNNLSSPSYDVIDSTFRDLSFQTKLLEMFGGKDMILHVGGRYEGKKPSIIRFKDRFKELPENTREYLRIENDDKIYNISDVVDLCVDLGCKPMFDYHHNICLPSVDISEVKDSLSYLWGGSRVKVHLSSGAEGRRDRHHSDYISQETWKNFSEDFQDMSDIDVMLEVKKKELSVFRVRRYAEEGVGLKEE